MSEPENFISRWSRRKAEAAEHARKQPEPSEKKSDSPSGSEPKSDSALGRDDASFDLASLPPIESIGAGSDVSAFLKAGVPVELTRAALRRAWASDPVIRDFIGLSENSWDFTKPESVPGFGSLTAEDARRLLAHVSEQIEHAAHHRSDEAAGAPDQSEAAKRKFSDAQSIQESNEKETQPDESAAAADGLRRDGRNIAAQKDAADSPRPTLARRHGGALPE